MLSRRELLAAGVASGMSPHAEAAPPTGSSTQSRDEIDVLREIARGVHSVDRSIEQAWLTNAVAFGHVTRVRGQMETYFRTNLKFPDFIDVGFGVFMDIYDWHIKNRQPLVISRGPDARYWMQFMFTTLILRGEHESTYVGLPYDKA